MVAMPLYSTSRIAPRLGRWPLTSLSHRLSISVGDAELGNALRTALVLRPEFIAANDNDAEVIVTDSHDTTSWNGAQILVVGSTEKPRHGETVIDSLDPSLILSAAAVLASGYKVTPDRQNADAIHLSTREKEVAALLAEGASNKVIARELDISVHTAKFHVTAVLDKLGARNRADAVAIALREGVVTL
ncbi:MAG TPA: LuxR C-terminal-related transcriptional regulator [Devosia sp.]